MVGRTWNTTVAHKKRARRFSLQLQLGRGARQATKVPLFACFGNPMFYEEKRNEERKLKEKKKKKMRKDFFFLKRKEEQR